MDIRLNLSMASHLTSGPQMKSCLETITRAAVTIMLVMNQIESGWHIIPRLLSRMSISQINGGI